MGIGCQCPPAIEGRKKNSQIRTVKENPPSKICLKGRILSAQILKGKKEAGEGGRNARNRESGEFK